MRKTIILTMLCMGMQARCLFAQQGLKTTHVSIFKDNSAFYQKSGTVATSNSMFTLVDSLPQARFGTLWLASSTSNIVNVSTAKEMVKQRSDVENYVELLKINIGKKMQILLKDSLQHCKGTLVSARNDLFSVKTSEGNWVFITARDIQRVIFLEEPNYLLEKEQIKPLMKVAFENKDTKQNLQLMYLQTGINWYPTYLLEIQSENKGRLTLQAEVVNDAEDILDSQVDFVVGQPNFRYASMLSPQANLTSGDLKLADIYSLNSSNTGNVPSLNSHNSTVAINQMYQSKVPPILSSTSKEEDLEVLSSLDDLGLNSIVLEGTKEENLFFYTCKNLTIKKGGRAMVDVFSTDVPLDHIYESTLPSNSDGKSSYYKYLSVSSLQDHPVYHSIRLVNPLSTPFTTGPIMVSKSGEVNKPISQDLLTYTPSTGSVYVKITTAPDVSLVHQEQEIARQEKAYRLKGKVYDLLTVEASISLKNFKDKDLKMNVKRLLLGQMLESEQELKNNKRVNYTGSPNDINDLVWEFTCKAGQDLVIKYKYKVYVLVAS